MAEDTLNLPLKTPLTNKQRIIYGVLGGLAPVFVSLIILDFSIILSQEEYMTWQSITGIVIRYTGFAFIGGLIAHLHKDENEPVKLFQIGVAAPALLSTLIATSSVQDLKSQQKTSVQLQPQPQIEQSIETGETNRFSFFSEAYASDFSFNKNKKPLLFAGLLGDFGKGVHEVARGLTGKIYSEPYSQPVNQSAEKNTNVISVETLDKKYSDNDIDKMSLEIIDLEKVQESQILNKVKLKQTIKKIQSNIDGRVTEINVIKTEINENLQDASNQNVVLEKESKSNELVYKNKKDILLYKKLTNELLLLTNKITETKINILISKNELFNAKRIVSLQEAEKKVRVQ